MVSSSLFTMVHYPYFRHAREGGHLRFESKKTQIPAYAGMTIDVRTSKDERA